jgi:predicted DNA-binding transcriptional regulator YafY
VSFNYTHYGVDKKKHVRTGADGEPTLFRVTPYQMVATNGRYYLVCSMDKYDTLGNYRVDRITNIQITSKPAKPKSKVKGMEHGFDLPKHMAEHIYMFHGDSVRVKFRAPIDTITDIVDWFGLDFDIKQADDEHVNITVLVNEHAMFHWAMQYGPVVEVLSPKRLRERIIKAVDVMATKYQTP